MLSNVKGLKMSDKTELLIELEKVRCDLKGAVFLSKEWQELDKKETYILNGIKRIEAIEQT